MEIAPKQFAIDFDGTLQFHEYPYLGQPTPYSVRVVRRIKEAGHTLILLTMRDDDQLEEAKAWLKDHELDFDYINRNEMFETGSRKVYAHYYIDDHNLGAPIIHDTMIHRKPFVDWLAIEKLLEEKKLI
jgi:hypothetical protein